MFLLKRYIYVIFSIITIILIYNLIYFIYYKKKFKKNRLKVNYEGLLNKINNNKYLLNLNYYIVELKKINNSKYKILSSIIVILLSIVFSIITFFISYKIFEIYSTAILLSIITLGIPYIIIESIYISQKQKIIDNFPMYILTLKNYVYTTNDIIQAFKKANIPDYLYMYINKFNISIEKGISITHAFEELKKDINIDVISDFLSSLLTCHLNGGNVCILLNKYAEMLTKVNIRNAKAKQENLSNIIVFFILVLINLFLLFSFVYSNQNYKQIMITTFIGKIIINYNILSYFVIFLLYRNANKKI